MKIGEIAHLTGVSIATIRLYEREGLIEQSSRTKGKLREFTLDQQRRLDFIKRVRNLGFSLDDVKALLTQHSVVEAPLMERMQRGIIVRKQDLAQLEECLANVSNGVTTGFDLDKAFETLKAG